LNRFEPQEQSRVQLPENLAGRSEVGIVGGKVSQVVKILKSGRDNTYFPHISH
jgi:hypothetical protein